MDSVDSNIDLELIAAFVDGRLSGEERARAVKLLAESNDALEVFANTLRVQRDAAKSTVIPITSARRWRRWTVAVPVAAAAVIAVVLVPRLASRPEPSPALEYATAIARTAGSGGELSPGWEQRGWSVTRGGSPSETARGERGRSAAESKSTFRLGVRSVDLQVALGRGDTALASRLTNEMVDDLKTISFSETAVVDYIELRSRLTTSPIARSIDQASSAERRLRSVIDSSTFAFGQWAGAAELAARAHNASFFESSLGANVLRSAIAPGGVAEEDAEALRSIDARLKQRPSDRVLDEVHEALQVIIRRRGS